MIAIAEQAEMFPSLPRNTVKPSVREMIAEYRRDFEKYEGLFACWQVAIALGVSRQRVNQMIDSGILRAKPYFNGTLFVPYCDVEARLLAKRDGEVATGRPRKK